MTLDELQRSFKIVRLEMGRLALEKFPAAEFPGEFSIPRRHVSAHCYERWPTLDLEAVERVVIKVHLLSRGRNRAAIMWIVNDEIGVAPDLNCPFARK